jgi:hypothetical protein
MFFLQRKRTWQRLYTVKKGLRFSRPQPGCHLPNSPWPGMIKLFPVRESLVNDVPAGEGKIAGLFLNKKINNKIIYFPFYKKYNIIHDRIKCTSHLSLGKIDSMVLFIIWIE